MNNNTTYTFTPDTAVTTTVAQVYPEGVAVPLGFEAVDFAPPQKGDKVIAADVLKGKSSKGPDMRVRTAREDNSPASSPRIIVEEVGA